MAATTPAVGLHPLWENWATFCAFPKMAPVMERIAPSMRPEPCYPAYSPTVFPILM